MNFLIQDLLDFAQIKAGKFRKNIQEFNIQEAIEEVMSIQKDQAARKGVELSLNLINISTEINPIKKGLGKENDLEIFSPIMKSDVSRI